LVIAATAFIAGVVGYAGWSLFEPDPYSQSERIVRGARRDMAARVRDFQRDVDWAVRSTDGAEAEIDTHLANALQAIDDIVDEARDRVAALDIALHTQRNRIDRIEGRAAEAREMIEDLANEAKQKLRGG
jgi:hypothetical protein